MTTKYWIDDTTAINAETEVELIDNSESGDARITLCKAREISRAELEIPTQNESWMYYLRTNGNPVMLCDGNGDEIVDALGLPINQVRTAITDALDEDDNGEWPLTYLPK